MSFALAWVIAFVSGFVALSCEILWYRAYSVGSGGAPPAFGMMLGFYLLGIAAGAAAARRVCRGAATSAGDARFLGPLGAFVLAANAVSFLVVPLLARIVTVAPWQASLPLVALAAGSLGAILPLASHFGVAPDDRAGWRVSWIFAGNIAGATIGTLLTGYVLMDLWPLPVLALLMVVFGCAAAAVVFARSSLPLPNRLASLAACAVCAIAAVAARGALFDGLWERLTFRREFAAGKRFVQVKENRNDVICVAADLRVYGGGLYDGALNTSLRDDVNNVWRAYGLAAYLKEPRDVLVIGMSGGAWSQVIAHLPGVERVTIVEINPGYLDVIAAHPQVSGLLRNPKVDIAIDDGRRWLRRHPDRKFDLIVQNTSQHWRAHSTHLLSREHLELAKSRLLPGGHFYFNTTESPDVLMTGLAVFPHAVLLWNFMLASEAPLIADEARFRPTLRSFEIEGRPVWDFARESEETAFEAAVGKCLHSAPRDSIRSALRGSTVITDDNMASEWATRVDGR
ncbi:MAG: spermidine [Planctomycetota bacterium]|nr:MAG: spermidine [Planctomycetota bacterium]